MNKLQILVVEDDAPVRNLITTTLKAHDYKHIIAENGDEAIRQASTCNPDIVLLDLGLPDMDGRMKEIERTDITVLFRSKHTECAVKDDRNAPELSEKQLFQTKIRIHSMKSLKNAVVKRLYHRI